jgi:hypothetical protein
MIPFEIGNREVKGKEAEEHLRACEESWDSFKWEVKKTHRGKRRLPREWYEAACWGFVAGFRCGADFEHYRLARNNS